MAFIKWKDYYKIGIEQVDDQHKKLIDIINDLGRSACVEKKPDIIGNIIDQLLDYTKEHFETEENYMQQFGFPEIEVHKKAHETLTGKVIEYKEKFHQGNQYISSELTRFLADWLTDHELDFDKNFAVYLENQKLLTSDN